MIEGKDVVLAVMGASAALAGFVLVFLGIIVASYQSYAGGVPATVVRPYRTSGAMLLATFALCLVTVAACLLWLLIGGSTFAYQLAVGLFMVQLVAVFLAAGWTTRMVLSQ